MVGVLTTAIKGSSVTTRIHNFRKYDNNKTTTASAAQKRVHLVEGVSSVEVRATSCLNKMTAKMAAAND